MSIDVALASLNAARSTGKFDEMSRAAMAVAQALDGGDAEARERATQPVSKHLAAVVALARRPNDKISFNPGAALETAIAAARKCGIPTADAEQQLAEKQQRKRTSLLQAIRRQAQPCWLRTSSGRGRSGCTKSSSGISRTRAPLSLACLSSAAARLGLRRQSTCSHASVRQVFKKS